MSGLLVTNIGDEANGLPIAHQIDLDNSRTPQPLDGCGKRLRIADILAIEGNNDVVVPESDAHQPTGRVPEPCHAEPFGLPVRLRGGRHKADLREDVLRGKGLDEAPVNPAGLELGPGHVHRSLHIRALLHEPLQRTAVRFAVAVLDGGRTASAGAPDSDEPGSNDEDDQTCGESLHTETLWIGRERTKRNTRQGADTPPCPCADIPTPLGQGESRRTGCNGRADSAAGDSVSSPGEGHGLS